MSRRALTVRWSLLVSALVAGGALVAVGGPLDPPAGPVTSTYKTLNEVEPRIAVNAANTPGDLDSLFKITQPGSYYLTGNVTGVSGKGGIEIASSSVTLDLMGFEVAGVPGSLHGVSATAAGLTGISIVNGSARNWGADGIHLDPVSSARLAGLHAVGNTGSGISIGGGSTITSCSARVNGVVGIGTGIGCAITGCTAASNGYYGIKTDHDSTVTGCCAEFNMGDGINAVDGSVVTACSVRFNNNGIVGSDGCTITDCSAGSNTLDGIRVISDCAVRGNTCTANGNGGNGAGVHATGASNRIEGNNCTLANRGVDVDAPGNIIIRNTCAGNNTDWSIAANNIFGPIIDRRAPATPAVSGFSASGTLGASEANANFSY